MNIDLAFFIKLRDLSAGKTLKEIPTCRPEMRTLDSMKAICDLNDVKFLGFRYMNENGTPDDTSDIEVFVCEIPGGC